MATKKSIAREDVTFAVSQVKQYRRQINFWKSEASEGRSTEDREKFQLENDAGYEKWRKILLEKCEAYLMLYK